MQDLPDLSQLSPEAKDTLIRMLWEEMQWLRQRLNELEIKRRLRQHLKLQPDQADGIRLRNRYDEIQDHLFVFLDDGTVPPTNNSSEPAIRMSTVCRRISKTYEKYCCISHVWL
ncbi:transposase [Leptothoe sp. LEGE 181152]|nr:transposase [Adonisia turfae]MDV3350215.1 transposase [Leptothoe sp. LEGE 181152]